MKKDLHPKLMNTKVSCLGCNTTFETKSTVEKIDVEICSACHPFYTGKQKLVDTAGRVDRFRARSEAAQAANAKRKTKATRKESITSKSDLASLGKDIKAKTVDTKKASSDDEE